MSCDDPSCTAEVAHVVEFDDSWENDRASLCKDCTNGMRRLEGVTVARRIA